MHLCLSCDQLCSASSIFCDNCRLSLLERRTEETQGELQPEQRNMGESGDGVQVMVDRVVLSSVEDSELMPTRERNEADRMWSWDTSGIYTIDTLKDELPVEPPASSVRPEPSPRRKISGRVRVALLIFSIIGVLALLTDGVLLDLSVTRHHPSLPVRATHQPVTHIHPKSFLPAIQASVAPIATPTATMTPLAGIFSLSVSQMVFTAVQGQTEPAEQLVKLYSNSQDAFTWQMGSTTAIPSWLHISAFQGMVPAGGSAQVTLSPQIVGLAPDTYTVHLLVKATDSQDRSLSGSPQMLSVTLNVSTPCLSGVSPVQLSFSASLFQPHPAPQTLSLTESGNCSLPINWQISADVTWLSFSPSFVSESDADSTVQVQVDLRDKLVGSYTGHISLQATDNQGALVSGTPLTVDVAVTVIG